MNDDRGISIYDDNWNFIKRINLKSLDQDISLRGNIFIDDDFIYIGNVFALELGNFFLKLDLNLHIINYQYFRPNTRSLISIAVDLCNKRIFLLWTSGFSSIHIDVNNLYLRKTSEINTTSIINNAFKFNSQSLAMVYFNSQLYISYVDLDFYHYIMVTHINGEFITKYFLIKTPIIWTNYMIVRESFTVDYFGNILFTSMGKLCLFEISLNETRNCIENYESSYNYPLFAQVDQSGRLIAIDSLKKKIKLYY
jgi:hypothetical protein